MSTPELRPGPPWITEEMVAAQPGLAPALLGERNEAAAAIADAIPAGGPVTVVGCGTSEHGAMAIAALLAEALGGGWPPPVISRQALDAAERPQRGGVCIGVSHDGGTRATNLALEAAEATTALITSRPDGPADIVLTTPVHDDSWCHTVAYTSAILAGAAIARELALEADAAAAEAVLRAEPETPPLDDPARVVCAGAGVDLITARELALKLAEGARVPTAALHLETLLHGHLAGEDASTAFVLVHTGGSDRIRRRARLAVAALREIGAPVRAIVAGDTAGLVPAGDRVIAPGGDALARLLGGAVALQRLTLALARARGVNPDLIRREEEPYKRAGEAAEGGDW